MKSCEHRNTVIWKSITEPFDMWFENHIYPSTDGLSIFFRDITARKTVEGRCESNERFEKLQKQ
jgi:hypothetical protein